jgi:TrmH family RNA methyltransferase
MRDFQPISKARLKFLRKLLLKKGREEEGVFLAEGTRLVDEALTSDWRIHDVCVTESFLEKETNRNLAGLARSSRAHLWIVRENQIGDISDTVTSQGIVAAVEMRTHALDLLFRNMPLRTTMVVLQDVADPGNVGTILRTCDWFGVNAVLCSGESVDLFNPKVVRASMGALFHIPVIGKLDLHAIVALAHEHECKVYATTLKGGVPLTKFTPGTRSLFLFGSEGMGLQQDAIALADGCVTIPSYGKAESLNVAVAAGIILGITRNAGA